MESNTDAFADIRVMGCAILSRTEGGVLLDAEDQRLVGNAVSGLLNEKEIDAFRKLHSNIANGNYPNVIICACGTKLSETDHTGKKRIHLPGHNITTKQKEICQKCIRLNNIPVCSGCVVFYKPDYRFRPNQSFFVEKTNK